MSRSTSTSLAPVACSGQPAAVSSSRCPLDVARAAYIDAIVSAGASSATSVPARAAPSSMQDSGSTKSYVHIAAALEDGAESSTSVHASDTNAAKLRFTDSASALTLAVSGSVSARHPPSTARASATHARSLSSSYSCMRFRSTARCCLAPGFVDVNAYVDEWPDDQSEYGGSISIALPMNVLHARCGTRVEKLRAGSKRSAGSSSSMSLTS